MGGALFQGLSGYCNGIVGDRSVEDHHFQGGSGRLRAVAIGKTGDVRQHVRLDEDMLSPKAAGVLQGPVQQMDKLF